MIFDKDLKLKIGGKEYNLCFPVKRVFEAERQLPERNLVKTMANQPLSIEALYILLKEGIRGGGVNITNEEAEQLFLQALEENSIETLMLILIAAVGKSGVFGSGKNKPAAANA